MKRVTSALVVLIFVPTVIAQDLPPGVLLLSRVKAHVDEELRRLGTISCLETVRREHQEAGGRMRPLDTIRLEVITNGKKELFASPGGRKFSEDHPMSYAASGMLGDGLFGPYLKDILLGGSVISQYKGEEEIGGQRLARYDYQLSSLLSGQTIRTSGGSGKVGLHGSYWADPQTYDVNRLELNADDFPPALPVTQMTTSINYVRTPLANDTVVLLPRSAEVLLAKYSGEADHNRMEFTNCHVFGAESTIDFNAPDSDEPEPRFGTASVDDTLRPLPGGLQIAVKLRSPISGDTAVGTPIDGVVAGNVIAKRDMLIPSDSLVRGRIRRMERYTDPLPYFIVGLEFTDVEVQGIRYQFNADLVDIQRAVGVERVLTTRNAVTPQMQTIETVSLFNLPGVAMFFDRGSKLKLPRDFRTVWKTRPLD